MKGKKIYRRTYNKTRKSVSLLLAIDKQKVVGYKIINGSVNGEIYLEFMKEIYREDSAFLMDNARIHQSKILKEYMKDKESKIIYNVPYNPETNPIEHVFSKLKNDVAKQNTNNLTALKESIVKCLKKTKRDHLANYYEKSLNI